MKLDNQQLLSEFYELIKEDYPHVSYEDLKDICFAPWMFLKEEMESGNLIDVRFEFFGVFTVLEGKVIAMQKLNKKQLEENKITQDTYDHYDNMYSKYHKRKEDEKI